MSSKRLYEPACQLVFGPFCARNNVFRTVTSVGSFPFQLVSSANPPQSRASQAQPLSTETRTPSETLAEAHADAAILTIPTKRVLEDSFVQPPTPTVPSRKAYQPPPNPFITTATCTLHAFPSLEPIRTITYPSTHLLLPLRRDILHRAVIYEGDKTRQGTASTKWRSEVHGSNRKIRPQKGTGSARLGNKKSPMLKGGGVAFGPKPRDFSTDLQAKVYDLAWRTALSYRYRRGELIVLDGVAEIERTGPGKSRWARQMLAWHQMGRDNRRSLFVTREVRQNLKEALASEEMSKEARTLTVEDIDVKDLLETGRLVIERRALNWIFSRH